MDESRNERREKRGLWRLRVTYADTDKAQIVHHASYLRYLEIARIEFLRENGFDYAAFERDTDMGLPVVEANLRYRAPARFDDELEITLGVERLGNTSMVSAIRIAREADTLVEGRIVHIFVRADRLNEKASIPDHLRLLLQRFTVDGADSLATRPGVAADCRARHGAEARPGLTAP